jgi:hypothetical protein
MTQSKADRIAARPKRVRIPSWSIHQTKLLPDNSVDFITGMRLFRVYPSCSTEFRLENGVLVYDQFPAESRRIVEGNRTQRAQPLRVV